MSKITGIGGIFIASENQERLSKWYKEILGVPVNENNTCEFKWREAETGEEAFSIFHVFSNEDQYLKPSNSSSMVNFRVDNLDEVIKRLKEAGVKVYPKIEQESYGRFGWIEDPDGNKIELWEPSPLNNKWIFSISRSTQ